MSWGRAIAVVLLLCGNLMAQVSQEAAGMAPPAPGSITDTSFADRLAETVMGRPIAPRPPLPRSHQPRPVLVGAPLPALWSPWVQPAPPVLLWHAPVATQTVVIHQTGTGAPPAKEEAKVTVFGAPAPRGESRPEPASATAESARFWIVLQTGEVFPAAGYWADGDSLTWIGQDNRRRTVAAEAIDREATLAVNAAHGAPIRLPRAGR